MNASVGPARLGTLLSGTWAFCTTYWKPILTAAIVLGALSAVLNGAIGMNAATRANELMNDMGMNQERMQNLADRMQAGDESAAAEMEAMLDSSLAGLNEANAARMMGMKVFGAIGPLIGLSFVIGAVLTVAGLAFFWMLALHPTQDALAIAKKIPSQFLGLLWLSIWTFLRSFAWIPLVGFVTAIILGPRFVLAPVIMLQEKTSATESVSASNDRTRGYWGKIIGNLIVVGLCLFVASIVIAVIAVVAGAMIPLLGLVVKSVGQWLCTAFAAVFTIRLSQTIMANPLAIVPAQKSAE